MAEVARSVAAGFDWHLVKPISVHELLLALDERLVREASEQS